MSKKDFFFNPNNPKTRFDIYKDKNPKDTITIKYSTKSDVLQTIKKLEKLYKEDKYPHKRISQVAMILRVRLRVIKDKNPKIDKGSSKNELAKYREIFGRFELSKKYTEFLKIRTTLGEKERKQFRFTF